ncbi:Transmembrane protein 138 [Anthophora plagiata]
MILSISLHIWDIKVHRSSSNRCCWTKDFHILHSLHKGVAVLYYYFYKRASLRIADPRFYESSPWIQNQFSLP